MATANYNPGTSTEPELNLLMPKGSEQGLLKSLFQNLDDFFFPKKLPPLQLESKPIPVRDIWGFYDYKKNGVLGSTVVHILVLAAIIGGTILAKSLVKTITAPKQVVTLIAPDETPALAPAKTQVGGGARSRNQQAKSCAVLLLLLCRRQGGDDLFEAWIATQRVPVW